MLPPFDDAGSLPPGVHSASLSKVEERFGCGSEVRRVQMESVRWMVDLAVRAGVQRIVLNGSFVTDIIEPNDLDCVLLSHDRGDPVNLRNGREVANTRRKLERLEALYRAHEVETGGDEELRDASMQSLKRFINQFKEEIARYETRLAGPR